MFLFLSVSYLSKDLTIIGVIVIVIVAIPIITDICSKIRNVSFLISVNTCSKLIVAINDIAANIATITIYALTLSALSTLFSSTFFLYISFSLSIPLIYLTVFPQNIPNIYPINTLIEHKIAPTIIHIVAGDSSIPPIFNNSYYILSIVLTIFFYLSSRIVSKISLLFIYSSSIPNK